jgi:tetratricopeptide (TPR) repeat protein
LQAAVRWHYVPARKMLTAAIEVWSRLGHVPGEIAARNTRGTVYRKLGEYEPAQNDHMAALALAVDHDLSGGEIMARTNLGAVHIEQGELDKAEARLNEAIALSEDTVDNWGAAQAQGFLGRLYEARKDWDAARAAYTAAIERWQIVQAPVEQVEASAGLARAVLAQGFTADALAGANAILRHLAEHGPDRLDEPLRVYLTLYRVLHIAGQQAEARSLLHAAYHLLEQLAAGLSDDERERFRQDVAVNRAIIEAWSSGEGQ